MPLAAVAFRHDGLLAVAPCSLMPRKMAPCTPGMRRKSNTRSSSKKWKASSPWIQRSCTEQQAVVG